MPAHKLTPKSGPECCVELVKGHIEAFGRPQDRPDLDSYPAGLFRVALYCSTCKAGVEFTPEKGWVRTDGQ